MLVDICPQVLLPLSLIYTLVRTWALILSQNSIQLDSSETSIWGELLRKESRVVPEYIGGAVWLDGIKAGQWRQKLCEGREDSKEGKWAGDPWQSWQKLKGLRRLGESLAASYQQKWTNYIFRYLKTPKRIQEQSEFKWVLEDRTDCPWSSVAVSQEIWLWHRWTNCWLCTGSSDCPRQGAQMHWQKTNTGLYTLASHFIRYTHLTVR